MRRLLLVLPESGRVLIDNIDISKVDTQALRNRVVRFQISLPLLHELSIIILYSIHGTDLGSDISSTGSSAFPGFYAPESRSA